MPSDEKPPLIGQHIPIPTYEEAMSSSRAASDYGGNDTEATTLLQQSTVVLSSSSSRGVPTRRDGYQPPTVESARSSVESSFLEEFASSPRSSAESLQREMIQMEVMDGDVDGVGRRPGGRLRQEFTKRFSSISSSLSAMSLPRNPFRGMNLFGGVRFPRIHIPEVPCFSRLGGEAMVPIYRILAVLAALIVVYVLLATDTFSFSRPVAEYTGPFDPESVRRYAEQGIDRGKIRHWLEYVSSFDHMAGTEGDLVLAKYVQGQFASFGLRTERMEYDVYLNYPKPGGRRVWMEKPKWEAVLEEPNVDKKHENTAVFHGHSKSGKAKGPVVFANFGTREDFKMLETEGISVKGAIVLIREGGPQPDRGLKIKAAQDKGAVGALLFSDPAVSGWDGPEDAVQRGSVSLSNWVMGDVLTPGWASLSDAKRIPTSESAGLLKIPSLPLPYNDVKHLLEAIDGKGKLIPDGRSVWIKGEFVKPKFWTGSLDSSPVVNLKNEQVERDRQPIWNVVAELKGVDHLDEKIIIGNHRDAWCFGASDPNSGTAIMLDVARVFGKMTEFGWRPKRTILFVNFDAEEYNMIGSTEFVEEGGDNLINSALAYINLNAAISGHVFNASGTPSLQSALNNVLGRVLQPESRRAINATNAWNPKSMLPVGSRGDYAAFQHHAGIPSIDLSFAGGRFPQNSCYDNYAYMKEVGDPTFAFHEAMAKVVILLLVELADTDIVSFNMEDYADALEKYAHDLQGWVHKKVEESSGTGRVDVGPLDNAIIAARGYIRKFTAMDEPWMKLDHAQMPIQIDDWAVALRRSRGIRMSNFDKHLLDLAPGGGVPGREWFKHMVQSPQEWGGDGYFPGVRDAVDRGDWEQAQKEVGKVAGLIERAAKKLLDELSPTVGQTS